MAYEELFDRLSRSKFRSGFRLNSRDARYLHSKGLARVLTHGREFVMDRLAPAKPFNDGKQTPMRGHPVFVAQHATGTCCRSCLAKYHSISANRELTDDEVKSLVLVIGEWLKRQPVTDIIENAAAFSAKEKQLLFTFNVSDLE